MLRASFAAVLVTVALAAGGCSFGGDDDAESTTTAPTGAARAVHGIGIGAGDPDASRQLAESIYRGYGPKSDSAAGWFAHIKQVALTGENGKATIRTDLTKGDPTARDDPVTSICRAATSYGASAGVVTNASGTAIAKCGFTPQP